MSNVCMGCEFIRIMSEDGTGFCKEHGDVIVVDDKDDKYTVIEILGGNELELEDE